MSASLWLITKVHVVSPSLRRTVSTSDDERPNRFAAVWSSSSVDTYQADPAPTRRRVIAGFPVEHSPGIPIDDLRRYRVHLLAPQPPAAARGQSDLAVGRQRVELLDPHPQQLPQSTRIATEPDPQVVVDYPAEVRDHQLPATFDVLGQMRGS